MSTQKDPNGKDFMIRKLMILQILCDDVLESEELKSKMNTRKESEVRMDDDAEESPIVHARKIPNLGGFELKYQS
ncbi:hypothetical protein MTR_4g055900 [Medicago truncatula]|uniref:WHIM1 domain-containing protein n=1 Tax=Medicago truncatula TaxID=3880 RepID=G7JM66_MEDTR|nr:hypothetical protein MTR_4g055900 [Medicago truncatula]